MPERLHLGGQRRHFTCELGEAASTLGPRSLDLVDGSLETLLRLRERAAHFSIPPQRRPLSVGPCRATRSTHLGETAASSSIRATSSAETAGESSVDSAPWPFVHEGSGGRSFCRFAHWSARALASSSREIAPCATRISPSRSPVSPWRRSAAASSSSVIIPCSTKISPSGLRSPASNTRIGTASSGVSRLARSSSPDPGSASAPRSSSAHCSAIALASSSRETPKRDTRISPSSWPVGPVRRVPRRAPPA